MAESEGATEQPVGPGNRIIATTALEWLTARGRTAARTRLDRDLGGETAARLDGPVWLDPKTLATIYLESELSPSAARGLGHRIAAPDTLGLGLYRLGMGTPEKAYRRIQALLPRDDVRDRWRVETLSSGRAALRYLPGAQEVATDGSGLGDRVEAVRCALRVGMLEAIPGLYGLLPATVRCESCRADGAAACRYAVQWTASPRKGLLVGLVGGIGATAGLGLWLDRLGGLDVSLTIALVALALVGPALGWAIDLHRQLTAVAGARRGQLALFDQVDTALAEKLDALARAETRLDEDDAGASVRRPASGVGEGVRSAPAPSKEILSAAQQIHLSAGELECWIEAQSGPAPASGTIATERARVREIREWAARIVALGDGTGVALTTSTDLARLVERALTTVRPTLPRSASVELDAEPGLAPIECEPLLIEQVVVQLVRNAVEASAGLSEAPRVEVSLRDRPRGVELAVVDRGVGIDSTEVDEVFDPFFGDRPTSVHGGMGLPVCLRIVERHGGELHIEAEARPGTRVSVLLPRSAGESLVASGDHEGAEG